VETLPDWVAAVAAIVAAGLVGWQSWETRKSAQASARAAASANASLELSRRTIEIAGTEEGHTRSLISEAVKTRIDQATPTLTLTLGNLVGPVELDQSAHHVNDPFEFVPNAHVYRLPRDKDHYIAMRQFFNLISDGTKIMMIDIPVWIPYVDEERHPEWVPKSEVGMHEIEIGGRRQGYLYAWRTVGEWVKIAEEGHTTGLPPYDFIIEYADPADNGAMDEYIIRIAGSPLRKIPDEMGSWAIKSGPPVPDSMTSIISRRRKYFISKLEGRQLE